MLLAGMMATLAVLAGLAYDAVRGPEIHAHSGNIENPFELRFSLHNPSLIFGMKNVEITCIGQKIILAGDNVFLNSRFTENVNVSVRPRQTVEYACPFDRFIGHRNSPTIYAQIVIGVRFRTIWFERDSLSDTLTWTAQSHQWVEGENVN